MCNDGHYIYYTRSKKIEDKVQGADSIQNCSIRKCRLLKKIFVTNCYIELYECSHTSYIYKTELFKKFYFVLLKIKIMLHTVQLFVQYGFMMCNNLSTGKIKEDFSCEGVLSAL